MELTNNDVLGQVAGMFCKYGVKSVSMDDIARELGVSKKTIYQHVKDKSELIELSFSYIKELHIQQIRDIRLLGLNAIDEIFETNKMLRATMANINPMVDFEMRKYYPHLHRCLNEKHDGMAQEVIINNIQRGIEEGLFRDDFNANLISMLHIGRVKHLIDLKDTDFGIDWMEAVTQLMTYHVRAIATPKGIELLEDNLKKLAQQ